MQMFFWQVLTFADLTTVVFILFILSATDRHVSRRLGACVSLCACITQLITVLRRITVRKEYTMAFKV